MKKIFNALNQQLTAEKNCVFCTIIANSGSTPRGSGARMLVMEDGTTIGTIGGGEVEYRSSKIAMDALKNKRSFLQPFCLTADQVASIGMICGGAVTVYFQYIDHDNPQARELCAQILHQLEQDEDSWLILDVSHEQEWGMGLYTKKDGLRGLDGLAESEIAELCVTRATQKHYDDRHYYGEPLVRSGMVYIFGGGHIAQELAPLLTHLNFRVTIFEDRPEFATRQLFPTVDQIIVGNPDHFSEKITIKESDYIVIMTRGHSHDYNIQLQAMRTPAHYLGVMGSREKLRILSEKMFKEGFTQADVDRLHSPIGTAIKAETPAEIAISVAGELILTRSERLTNNG